MDRVIDVVGLVKSFGSTRALDGLDLSVSAGSVHGFLGPNGAGKSTTIRVLLGLLRADAGTVRLLGGDPWADSTALHRRLAYVPGEVALWPTLTGGETIDLLGRLRGGIDPARRDALVEQFGLDPTKKVRALSRGNRQKVLLVSALASDAELLVFDEPTEGLDPLMAQTFRTCVAAEQRAGRTVLLSSHVLAEVEALCDRVTIIRDGRTVESGTLDDLRHLTRTSIEAELASVPAGLGGQPGVHDLRVTGTTVRCAVDTGHLGALLAVLTAAGVHSLSSRPPTLEELFLSHYGPSAAPTAPADATATAADPGGAGEAGGPDGAAGSGGLPGVAGGRR